MFLFQNSRRQLLALLLKSADDASRHRDEHIERGKPEDEAEKKKIDNLLKAAKAADEQIRGLEFWSDVRHVEENDTRDSIGDKPSSPVKPSLDGQTDELSEQKEADNIQIGDGIKGISEDADLGYDGTRVIFDSTSPSGPPYLPASSYRGKEKVDSEDARSDGVD